MAAAIEDLAERIKADSTIYIDTGKFRARRGSINLTLGHIS